MTVARRVGLVRGRASTVVGVACRPAIYLDPLEAVEPGATRERTRTYFERSFWNTHLATHGIKRALAITS